MSSLTLDRVDLERRLEAGEWLKPGAVAVLLGVTRKTVYNMCLDGRLKSTPHGGGKQRLIDPASVRARLSAGPDDMISYERRAGPDA